MTRREDCTTCYERDEERCYDGMCLRTGCRLRNDRLSQAEPGYVVKPLEWGPYPYPAFAGPDVAIASFNVFGGHHYQVQRDPNADGYMAYLAPDFGTFFWESKGHSDIENAKAAAQADFEQRIRSAITATVRTAEPGYVADRETIAEAMWRGELRRAAGKERNIPWSEVSETDQARWLYLADAAIAALPAPTTASAGWQPIETAPKDGTGFIFYQPVVGGRRIIDSGYFDGELFRAVDFYGVDDPVVNPTHWMPLPAAPTKRSAT